MQLDICIYMNFFHDLCYMCGIVKGIRLQEVSTMVLTALLKEREERTKLLDQQIKEKDALIQKLKQERIDPIRGLLADGLL